MCPGWLAQAHNPCARVLPTHTGHWFLRAAAGVQHTGCRRGPGCCGLCGHRLYGPAGHSLGGRGGKGAARRRVQVCCWQDQDDVAGDAGTALAERLAALRPVEVESVHGASCWCCVCKNRYQLEQQAAALAKEVSKLRAEGEQEVLLTESAGAAQMSLAQSYNVLVTCSAAARIHHTS